jgi:REP element-mobilizing transposase RayT
MRAGRLPSFRKQAFLRVFHEAFAQAQKEGEFSIVEFGIEDDHLHFIVEAEDGESLSRAGAGLAIRLARAVNRLCGRKGQVWPERFHTSELRSPRQVRNALVYVIQNRTKHSRGARAMDPYSSAGLFDGWVNTREAEFLRWEAFELSGLAARAGPDRDPVVVPFRTWLGTTGWIKYGGRIDPSERPRAARGRQ